VKRVDYFIPVLGNGAEILHGTREENIDKVLELVAAKGGLK
jgi:electron transfer flavoprotein beta subunit